MCEALSEELVPQELRSIYGRAHESVEMVQDARLQLALVVLLRAMHNDILGEGPHRSDGSRFAELNCCDPRSRKLRLARSR